MRCPTRSLRLSTIVIFLGVLLTIAPDRVAAQSQILQLVSPVRNQQVCLGSAVDVKADVMNVDCDTVNIVVLVEISNVSTGITTYRQSDTLWSAKTGLHTLDLPPYVTNFNILSQLGTFRVLATVMAVDDSGKRISDWRYQQTVVSRLFGIRHLSLPVRETSTNYSKTGSGGADIPNQFVFESAGSTVVEGDNEVWDPLPPRDTVSGYGPDHLHSPTIRLDRQDEAANFYTGSGVGDTLTSFPINASGTHFLLTFNLMRSGKHLYPALWDAQTPTGAESAVIDVNGSVLRTGDSLILEFADPQSDVCSAEGRIWHRVSAYDGGHDLAFQSVRVLIDSDMLSFFEGTESRRVPAPVNYLDTTFQFRFRLSASNEGNLADDADPFYLDNIYVQRLNHPELTVLWAKVVTPYTKLPFGALQALPIDVRLQNYATAVATNVPLTVAISNSAGEEVHRATVTIPRLSAMTDTVISVGPWNAQSADGPEYYTISASLVDGYDSFGEDNETFSKFYLPFDRSNGLTQEYAYDDAGVVPNQGSGNDIPFLTNIKGDGIGFANATGSYAVKFVIPNRDTIYGARLYFANSNQSPDAIRISLHTNDTSTGLPGDTLHQESVRSTFEDVRRGGYFNQFWPFYFPKPIVVEPGTYWLSVSQLSVDNMMLGGDLSRGGATIAIADEIDPKFVPIYSDPYGTQWSETGNNGDVTGVYAVESPAGAGNWQRWMPVNGYWPCGNRTGIPEALVQQPLLRPPYTSAGTYLPMIRLLVQRWLYQDVRESTSSRSAVTVWPCPASFGPVSIGVTLDQPTSGSIEIVDALGRTVRDFGRPSFQQGEQNFVWDMLDNTGHRVPPGYYDVRLNADGHASSARIVIVP